MQKLRQFFFNNILPATFQESKTYLEQIRVLKNKLNEVIEVVNSLQEEVNNLKEEVNNLKGGGNV